MAKPIFKRLAMIAIAAILTLFLSGCIEDSNSGKNNSTDNLTEKTTTAKKDPAGKNTVTPPLPEKNSTLKGLNASVNNTNETAEHTVMVASNDPATKNVTRNDIPVLGLENKKGVVGRIWGYLSNDKSETNFDLRINLKNNPDLSEIYGMQIPLGPASEISEVKLNYDMLDNESFIMNDNSLIVLICFPKETKYSGEEFSVAEIIQKEGSETEIKIGEIEFSDNQGNKLVPKK